MAETQHGAERNRMLPGASADELIENAFPTDEAASHQVYCRRVFAVIPQEAFRTSPEEFSCFLGGVFEAEEELDDTVDRILSTTDEGPADSLARRVRALVPSNVMDSSDPTAFVDEIFNVFDEIDQVLLSLKDERRTATTVSSPATAVVPEEVVADPQELIRTIDRLQSEAEKLDLLFRQAKHDLKRLRAYRLSRRPAGQVLNLMRRAEHLPTLQYLIDFLSSILQAAESFEKIELPRPHIRDYLEYLYRMEDWDGMAELVRRLQGAVRRFCEG